MRLSLHAITNHPAVARTVVICKKYGPERHTIAETLHIGITPAAALVAFEWGSAGFLVLALVSMVLAKHLQATVRKGRARLRRHPPRGE